MYAPLTIPVLTALVSLFWLTLLTGFVGLGMHLRGFDRQMAGVPLFNWLQGPPAFVPALFVGLAAIGLVTAGLISLRMKPPPISFSGPRSA
jgi:hypothetical protein